jgi:hypothetical protein
MCYLLASYTQMRLEWGDQFIMTASFNNNNNNNIYIGMNWAVQIKTTLAEIGMSYICQNQYVTPVNFIKQRISYLYTKTDTQTSTQHI